MTESPERTWLRNLPKCELHLHLEGTISPPTLVELSKRHDTEPLTLQDAEELYKYEDFLGFLKAFGQVTQRLKSPDDYELITYDMIKSLAASGVRHAEVYISFSQILRFQDMSIEEAMQAAERGRTRGEGQFGVSVYWIVDVTRQRGPEEFAINLGKVSELRPSYPSLVGIGIGGDEAGGPAVWFKDLFAEAKEAGLRVVAHAGEAVPPFSIWDAIDIGAERIGHALTAESDAALLEVLKEKQIPLELCITSNICTGGCKSAKGHPIRKYFDMGLMVTLNTDDPPMFGTTLLNEYELVQRELAFSNDEMITLTRNSIVSSFLPTDRKAMLLEELDAFSRS